VLLTESVPARKRRGGWYTPHGLVDRVIANTLAGWEPPVGRPVRVLDPACGDGRFLVAAGDALAAIGAEAHLVGVDVDEAAAATARESIGTYTAASRVEVVSADALARSWGDDTFDVVIGNPPFLSQMSAATSRGASSRHGGGPYADAAVEFLALAARLVAPGGRLGLVLPQSVLASRDAAAVRAEVERRCRRVWSWWSPNRVFDADVVVCAIGFEGFPTDPAEIGRPWTDVVTGPLGVPALGSLHSDGTLGDRAVLNANFRDEYYGMVPAVSDGCEGSPLVTSGLIDPARCLWGERPVRFARQRFVTPRVDVERLTPRMQAWAARKLVPKVLVANQTRVVEAVADPDGAWLPGVPVTSVNPFDGSGDDALWEIAAVLTSATASAWATHELAGTGLSPATLRVGPRILAALPWPAGDLASAVGALRDGDVVTCGAAVDAAFGVTDDALRRWWVDRLPVRD
jgi:SAM-dependent methyltransferase